MLSRGLVEDFDFVEASSDMRRSEEIYYRFVADLQRQRDGEALSDEEASPTLPLGLEPGEYMQ